MKNFLIFSMTFIGVISNRSAQLIKHNYLHIITTRETVRNMSKFCANLSFMFNETPFLERYQLAKQAGFKCVESAFPNGFSKEDVVNAKNASGVNQVLINVFAGDANKGEFGFAALPGKEKQFQESIDTTISYATALGAKKIHVMSGKLSGEPTRQHDETYENNLRYAVKLFEKHNIIGLIEPINKYSLPNYYMNCYSKALDVIKKIDSPNLRMMLDVFHLQQIKGSVTNSIKEYIPYIGHVQIAQVPNRNEPDTPGELNYTYVLKVLSEAGYNDWIGLEYKPLQDSESGLKWIKHFGYSL